MSDGSRIEPAPSTPPPVDPRIEQWAGEIMAAQRRADRLALPGWFLLAAGAVLLCLSLSLLRAQAKAGLVLVAAAILGAVLFVGAGAMSRRRAAVRLSGEIRQRCREEGLAIEGAVGLLAGRTKGRVRDKVLATVDPGAAGLARIHERGEEAFHLLGLRPVPLLQFQVIRGGGRVTAVILQGEHRIDEFASLAADCLEHRSYVEGLAALAMVDMIYHEIAPAAPDYVFQPREDDLMHAAAAAAAHILFSGFDLKSEMAAVVESQAGRHAPSISELVRRVGRPVSAEEQLPRNPVAGAARLRTRDAGFVGDCIDYIGRRTREAYKQSRAWELLAYIPDARTLPYLLAAMERRFFFPEGIRAIGLLGEEGRAQLVEAVRSGRGHLRFNAAMALGFLQVEAAHLDLAALLPTTHSAVERAGMCYALTRLGENGHLEALAELLEERDADGRHAAAIALEHLEEPLGEEVALRRLEDESARVRLHVVRKLAARATSSPRLVEALVARLGDGDEQVQQAAVGALGRLAAEKVYDQAAALAASASGGTRLAALRLLGMLARPEAVPLLEEALVKETTSAGRGALILALGDTGAARAAGSVAAYLDDEGLSSAALTALLRIGLVAKEAAVKSLQGRPGSRIRLLALQAVGGDAAAIEQLARAIRLRTGFLTLLEVLEVAPLLREPSFAAPLREVLSYRNHPRFPGDRSVSYLALKALVHSELAKQ
jgi:HEAT repeat protein